MFRSIGSVRRPVIGNSVLPLISPKPGTVIPALSVKSARLASAAPRLEQNLRATIHVQTDAELTVESQLAEDDSGRPEMLVKLVRRGELLSLSLLKLDPQLLQ